MTVVAFPVRAPEADPQSEQAMRQLLAATTHTHAIVISCDAQRRIQWVNPAFVALTGYSQAQAQGHTPDELLQCPQTDPATARELRERLEAGEGVRTEILNRSRSGRLYWVDMSVQPVRDDRGTITGYITIEFEISQLVASRHRLAAVFESAACGLLVYNHAGHIVETNAQGCLLLDLTREQLMGAAPAPVSWHLLTAQGKPLPKEDNPAQQTLRTGLPVRDAVIGVHLADHTLRWLLVSTQPVEGDTPLDRGVVCSFTDITSRREQSDSLRHANEEANQALMHLKAYRTALDGHSIVAVTDPQGRITFANKRFCEISGYSEDELIGQTHRILKSDRNPPGYFKDLWLTITSGQNWNGVICNRTKTGALYWVDTTIVPIKDGDGQISQYVAIRYDITSRKRAEQQLRESRERFKSLMAMSSDWYWEQDEQLRFTLISEGIDTAGMNRNAMMGKRRWELDIDPAEGSWTQHQTTLEARLPFRSFEYRVRDASDEGQWRWFSVSGQPFFDANGKFGGYRGVGREITSRRSVQEQLWQLANVDPLTRLPNRMMFNNALDQTVTQALEQNTAFALAIIDVDNFKEVNDALGHDAGDQLLRNVAQRLKSALRQSDLVARLGGDEFGVIIHNVTDAALLTRPLEAMMAAVGEPLMLEQQPRRCTISMGVTLFPADATEGADLVKNADIALYRAKAAGRSQYVLFQPELRLAVEKHTSMLQEIEEAIRTRSLTLFYQPVIDASTRTVLGVEALLRWNHPQRGIVAAGQFAQVFDNMDLSARIGHLVTDMAVAQAAQWQREGVAFEKIAINVTAADFVLGAFPDWLADRLAHYQVPAHRICIEVTEGMFLGRTAGPVVEALERLHDMGSEIAFDDFGTGYASLMHLKLPIDRLKIDRSFVIDIENDPINASIVQAVAQLGHRLGKQVTVEGVESAEQIRFLRSLGCHQFQGYFFSKPLPAAALPAFLHQFSLPLSLGDLPSA